MSGLYQNDGSKKLLWSFHEYYYDDKGLTFASDGVHLIKARGYVRDFDAKAISFFANGKVVRTWHVWELVSDQWQPQLERDALAAMMGAPGQKPPTIFQWARSKSLDDDGLKYSVETLEGHRFTFDVRTGETITGPDLVVKKTMKAEREELSETAIRAEHDAQLIRPERIVAVTSSIVLIISLVLIAVLLCGLRRKHAAATTKIKVAQP